MSSVISRDIEYRQDDTRMLGLLCAPSSPTTGGAGAAAGVLLVHDAFGVSGEMVAVASRLAALGHPVLAADVWGERRLPGSEAEIGPLIGGMVGDRDRWMARIRAAHSAAVAQPEFTGRPLVLLGYCFGGSSALEYLRTGADVAGAISVHGGLDLLAPDWSQALPSSVLICAGADDPMATAQMRTELTGSLDAAGTDWQLHLYSDTTHAFTSPKVEHSPMPDVVAYNPRSAARAWAATVRFLREIADPEPVNDDKTRTPHA